MNRNKNFFFKKVLEVRVGGCELSKGRGFYSNSASVKTFSPTQNVTTEMEITKSLSCIFRSQNFLR